MKILTGARTSPLSVAQFREVCQELRLHHPEIELVPFWADSPGDRDKNASLKTLEKTDFFTRDLDLLLNFGKIRIAIHSAKDLPEPLPKGLAIIALTRGQDPRDCLVLKDYILKQGAVIATSSVRREENLKKFRRDLQFIDLRGTIHERLAKLESGEADGVVVAEAALIRLQLTSLNRIFLPGPTAPLQGRLAILAREDDLEMKEIFRAL